MGWTGRLGGGRSILTTAGALGGGEHTGQLALLQPLDRRLPVQCGMGPLQPGRLGKRRTPQGLQRQGSLRFRNGSSDPCRKVKALVGEGGKGYVEKIPLSIQAKPFAIS